MIVINVSLGELLDKISILSIKHRKVNGKGALANVSFELKMLHDSLAQAGFSDSLNHELYENLCAVNESLWAVEDEIRVLELEKNFGSKFIELARSIYRLNDKRAAIKRELSINHGSAIIEEKCYPNYKTENF